jgi:hypothetical protein
MQNNGRLAEIEKRVNQSVYEDGVVEAFCGLFLLVFGTLFQVNASLAGFAVLAIFVFKPLMERVKQRWIYPRSGYMKPIEDPKELSGIVIAGGLFVLLLIATLLIAIQLRGVEAGRTIFLDYLLPPIAGILMAIGPWWMAQEKHIGRGYLWAAMFVSLGFAMPLFQIRGGYAAVGLCCTVAGLAMLMAGIAVFISFVRRHPLAGDHDAFA